MRILHGFSRGLLILGVSLLSFCPSGQLVAAPPATFEVYTDDTEYLQPSSTLEVRFSHPMIGPEQVGSVADAPPIEIEPKVPGRFTWLSRRSLVFEPVDAPWPLGKTIRVRVKPGAKASGGEVLAKNLEVTFSTPPFGKTAIRAPGSDREDNLSPKPEVVLAYNLPVQLESAAKCFAFVDAKNRKVRAVVRYGTARDYMYLGPEQKDWMERWKQAQKQGATADAEDESEDEGEDEESAAPEPENAPPIKSRLVVTPADLLTPGAAWRLIVKPGVRSEDGKLATKESEEIALGTVRLFAITTVEPRSYINSGRSVMVSFGQPLEPDITDENAGKYFRIEPAVPGIRFDELFDNQVTISGSFERDRDYTVTVDPSIVSAAGAPFEGDRQRTFRFGPVEPRLYLPEITAHQIQSGRRKFEVLSVNLRNLKVTARLVPADRLAAAVKAFDKYSDDSSSIEGESYAVLKPEDVGGSVIFERTISFDSPAIDARQITPLDWSEILNGKKTGAIFLTVEGDPLEATGGKRVGAQALVQLTDLAVLWKKTDAGLVTTVYSMETGKPLPEVRLRLLDEKMSGISDGDTDASGSSILAVSATPAWLVAAKAEDAYALRFAYGGGELPMAAFRVPISYSSWDTVPSVESDARMILFADRPLYRPGETVHVKGIVRASTGGKLAPAVGAEGSIVLIDNRGEEHGQQQIRTGERGSFDADVRLGSGMVGRHTVRLQLSGSTLSGGAYCSFEVADFQPNAFELKMDLPDRLAPGSAVKAGLSGNYFFGAPLSKAQVRWTLRFQREGFTPPGFEAWTFGEEPGPESRTLTLSGEGDLNAQGRSVIEPQLPSQQGGTPYVGMLTAEVTDINQQTVTESRSFKRDTAAFYLGAPLMEGIVARESESFPVRTVAVSPDGIPLNNAIDVQAELIYVRYDTVRVQGAGKAISFRSEKTEKVVATQSGKTLMPIRVGPTWQVREGETVSFKPEKAGQYQVRLTAKDANGLVTTTTLPLWVAGKGELAWDYRNPAQIELVPDKQEYRPGDVAKVFIKTPISGEALVTIERERHIIRTMRVRLEGNAPVLEVPLQPGDAPNVFVSVMLVRGSQQSTRKFKTAECRYGLTMLRVTDPETRLRVDVKTVRPDVMPGEEIETAVHVLDAAGKPVPNAEVTFFAVDDGILALTGYERPAPEKVFNEPFVLSIRTGMSIIDLLPEDPGDLEFSNKGYLIGGGGLEGPGLKLRKDFPGTAIWQPALITDKNGTVQAKFRAPDALTRYRLVAVVHSGATQFGSAESAVNIRQPLMLLPALGQVANVGDRLIARAVVRNDTGADGTVQVTLALDRTAEAAENKPLNTAVPLRNGEARAVDLPVQIREMGEAEWKWSAEMKGSGTTYSDSVVSSISVGSAAPVLREVYLPDLSGASADLLNGINPQLLEGTGSVAVGVASTQLASLREGADRLLTYPYGCAEQTTSGLVPWILMPRIKAFIPDLAKRESEATSVIRDHVERLSAMRTDSGGLSMWPGGRRPSLFISSYAVLALSMLQDREKIVPQDNWESLLGYLSEALRGIGDTRDGLELSDQCFAAWALAAAGKAEPSYHEVLYKRRKELSFESRTALALAILDARGSKKIAQELLSPRMSAPDSQDWFGGPARERALKLLAWLKLDPKSKEVPALVKELLGYRVNGHWNSTQQNAWALLALSRYYDIAEGTPQEASGEVVADKKVPFHVTADKPVSVTDVQFDSSKPLSKLTVENPAKARLFGEARFAVRPKVIEQPRQDRGFAVSRTYQKLASDGSIQELGDLRVGDRILVTLRVETARPANFVAVDDPLPAVLEAVNPAFQAREVAGGERLTRDWAADYREMRKDRVVYFCDHLPAGEFTFRYLARVRSAGSVMAGATKAEEMYRSERFGLGETTRMEVKSE